jgi:hypothetical protein
MNRSETSDNLEFDDTNRNKKRFLPVLLRLDKPHLTVDIFSQDLRQKNDIQTNIHSPVKHQLIFLYKLYFITE